MLTITCMFCFCKFIQECFLMFGVSHIVVFNAHMLDLYSVMDFCDTVCLQIKWRLFRDLLVSYKYIHKKHIFECPWFAVMKRLTLHSCIIYWQSAHWESIQFRFPAPNVIRWCCQRWTTPLACSRTFSVQDSSSVGTKHCSLQNSILYKCVCVCVYTYY